MGQDFSLSYPSRMKRLPYSSVNWAKTDIITPEGQLLLNRRFVMSGRQARIILPPNATEVSLEFEDFWYHEGSSYRGRTADDRVWEVLKLRCNCR